VFDQRQSLYKGDKYEAVYKPDITVPVSIMINSNKAIGMFVASVNPSALGRCDDR
jgi:hypothetical protein